MKPKKTRRSRVAGAAKSSGARKKGIARKAKISRKKLPATKPLSKQPAKSRKPAAAVRAPRTRPTAKPRGKALTAAPTPLGLATTGGEQPLRSAVADGITPAPREVVEQVGKPPAAPRAAEPQTHLGRTMLAEPRAVESKATVSLPAILLEGDEPCAAPAPASRPKFLDRPAPAGPRASLAGEVPSAREDRELPEAYGTGRLLLLARDPHCIYAHWDLSAEQLRGFNSLAVEHHLILRMHFGNLAGPIATELHVHPESRHWFAHVERDNTEYVAELGYYGPGHLWRAIAVSDAVRTPRIAPVEERGFQTATFRFEEPGPAAPGPFWPGAPERAEAQPQVQPAPGSPAVSPPATVILTVIPAGAPLLSAQQHFAASPEPKGPRDDAGHTHATPSANAVADWTPAQERALSEVLGWMLLKQETIGSAEILEWLGQRRQPEVAISSLAAAILEKPGPERSPGISSPGPMQALEISSPLGGVAPKRRSFWFNINAELVIYGATEPDATVRIGGRAIRLREDGSFSYRFALPDGQYPLPIAATSTDGETRRADLQFSRSTIYHGDVTAHPQDPSLKQPLVEHVS